MKTRTLMLALALIVLAVLLESSVPSAQAAEVTPTLSVVDLAVGLAGLLFGAIAVLPLFVDTPL